MGVGLGMDNPILQALAATGFTWFLTALGAATVFFFVEINRKTLDAMLGFAAGVMMAARGPEDRMAARHTHGDRDHPAQHP